MTAYKSKRTARRKMLRLMMQIMRITHSLNKRYNDGHDGAAVLRVERRLRSRKINFFKPLTKGC